jgi:hypothetical protein
MAKNTQAFILFNMLKAAGSKGVTRDQVATALQVKETSVPVYFFGMKKLYNADIETVKNGRQVVAYKLLNPDQVTNVPQTRGAGKIKVVAKKPLVKAAKVVKTNVVDDSGEIPTLDSDLRIAEITDREFGDIKSSLGLD